jgi:hypothetical protein
MSPRIAQLVQENNNPDGNNFTHNPSKNDNRHLQQIHRKSLQTQLLIDFFPSTMSQTQLRMLVLQIQTMTTMQHSNCNINLMIIYSVF